MIYTLIIGFVLIMTLAISQYFSRHVVFPKVLEEDALLDFEAIHHQLDLSYKNPYKEESIYIQSRYGYSLHGLLIENSLDTCVIICHGIKMSHISSHKYAEIFLKMGYSVLLIDHRNHGKSSRNFTTFGYFEKYDLQSWMNFLEKTFDGVRIGLHGESMGASTILQLAMMDKRPAFCIADCGFSDVKEIFKYRLRYDFHPLMALFLYPTEWLTKLIYHWSFKDVNILKDINKIACPIFFIHGKEDLYVPTQMTVDLYHAFQGEKNIYLAENAKHARSYQVDPDLYGKRVRNFIEEYCKTTSKG